MNNFGRLLNDGLLSNQMMFFLVFSKSNYLMSRAKYLAKLLSRMTNNYATTYQFLRFNCCREQFGGLVILFKIFFANCNLIMN